MTKIFLGMIYYDFLRYDLNQPLPRSFWIKPYMPWFYLINECPNHTESINSCANRALWPWIYGTDGPECMAPMVLHNPCPESMAPMVLHNPCPDRPERSWMVLHNPCPMVLNSPAQSVSWFRQLLARKLVAIASKVAAPRSEKIFSDSYYS